LRVKDIHSVVVKIPCYRGGKTLPPPRNFKYRLCYIYQPRQKTSEYNQRYVYGISI